MDIRKQENLSSEPEQEKPTIKKISRNEEVFLRIIRKKERKAQDIFRIAEKITGLNLSSGNAYPILKKLEEKKLAEKRMEGCTSYYSITLSGNHYLSEWESQLEILPDYDE